ncbi:MAG TPA: nucleotide sugar dehydrogenase [Solirubrobacteraceae bacterium]|nr:nucleotide sugar dehydrogenase [Solirubrobacteraceae bacterium]
MSAAREPIAVIGTGYVGLVTAAGFAELGSEVWCVDIDADKIARLRRGEVPIYEPGLEELIARHAGRLHFATDLAGALEHARLLFVAVGTPPTYSGDADLSAVHAVVDAIPASDRHALVMKSTVPSGTGAAIKRAFAEHGKDGLRYVSCPEFLKEGSAIRDFLHPDRVVVGDDGDWAGDAVVELYRPLLGGEHGGEGSGELVRTDIASAEMVKLASNAFLATKISFINEIANVCEETGADVVQVARGMGLDERIGPKFLQAGIGFGGSCFAPGETVLARQYGRTTLLTFEALWDRVSPDSERLDSVEALRAFGAASTTEVIEPDGLEVLSWVTGDAEPCFLPVMALTRRPYAGELLEIRTKMGRRVRTTPDHPWLVADGNGGDTRVKLAFELTSQDWVPVAGARVEDRENDGISYPLDAAIEVAGLADEHVLVRPPRAALQELLSRPIDERRLVFTHPRGAAARTGDVRRSGTLLLDEAPCDDHHASDLTAAAAIGRLCMSWDWIDEISHSHYAGEVYSLEVPYSHTVVTTGGVTTSNCFPKDVNALKQLAGNSGYHFQLLTAVIEVNELQKRRVIGKLQKHLGTLVGKRVALLGLAFKPDTDDMREASSLVLAARLHADGASVAAYDPVAEDEARGLIQGLDFADTALAAARDADALVLVTEWPQCTDLDWGAVAGAMRGRVVIDGRNALDRDALHAAGLVYEGIGRGLPAMPRDRRREDRAEADGDRAEADGDRAEAEDSAQAPEPRSGSVGNAQRGVTAVASPEGEV